MIQKIRQGDYPKDYLGNTPYTIARWGCLVGSVTSYLAWLLGKVQDIRIIAKKLAYTKEGNLIWGSLKEIGLKLVRRVNYADVEAINKALKHPTQGIMLQVEGWHWVFCIGKNILGGYRIMDPLRGDIASSRRYKYISGLAIIDKL